MKKVLLSLALCCAFFACQNNPSPATQTPDHSENAAPVAPSAPAPKKNIVFFGNSLTAAYGLEKEEGFPALIQQTIDSLGLPYTCINAGLSGETTASGKSRADWVLQQKADVFVLELGGNDALRGLPVEQSKQNLLDIVDKVRAKYPDCKIVLAGMLAPPNLGPTYTRKFRDMYAEIAQTKKVALIPFLLEGVGGDPKLNQADQIHPTAAGNKIVAKTVWTILRPLL